MISYNFECVSEDLKENIH